MKDKDIPGIDSQKFEIVLDKEWFPKETDFKFIAGWNSAEKRLEQIINKLQKEEISSVVYALREVIKRMKK